MIPPMTALSPTLRVAAIAAAQTRPLRQRVLRPQQRADELVFPGDDAPHTVHLGGFLGQDLVAVASAYREPPPGEDNPGAFRLRGMAVEAPLQGRGHGGVLLDAVLEHARTRGGELLWCNARVDASAFYRSRGFAVDGAAFDIPGIGPHYLMRRSLRASQAGG
jgi:GNAT superfamily N-acetyltransferase